MARTHRAKTLDAPLNLGSGLCTKPGASLSRKRGLGVIRPDILNSHKAEQQATMSHKLDMQLVEIYRFKHALSGVHFTDSSEPIYRLTSPSKAFKQHKQSIRNAHLCQTLMPNANISLSWSSVEQPATWACSGSPQI